MPRRPVSTLFPYTTLFRSRTGLRPGPGRRPRRRDPRVRLSPGRRRGDVRDRKSTRLNSSHVEISYAVFCVKKKKTPQDKLGQSSGAVKENRRSRTGKETEA